MREYSYGEKRIFNNALYDLIDSAELLKKNQNLNGEKFQIWERYCDNIIEMIRGRNHRIGEEYSFLKNKSYFDNNYYSKLNRYIDFLYYVKKML